MSYRTLRELDEEAKAGASSLSKKKRDTTFLRQKSEQYKKQVAALEVNVQQFYFEKHYFLILWANLLPINLGVFP